jgi:hypothetical protein
MSAVTWARDTVSHIADSATIRVYVLNKCGIDDATGHRQSSPAVPWCRSCRNAENAASCRRPLLLNSLNPPLLQHLLAAGKSRIVATQSVFSRAGAPPRTACPDICCMLLLLHCANFSMHLPASRLSIAGNGFGIQLTPFASIACGNFTRGRAVALQHSVTAAARRSAEQHPGPQPL